MALKPVLRAAPTSCSRSAGFVFERRVADRRLVHSLESSQSTGNTIGPSREAEMRGIHKHSVRLDGTSGLGHRDASRLRLDEVWKRHDEHRDRVTPTTE